MASQFSVTVIQVHEYTHREVQRVQGSHDTPVTFGRDKNNTIKADPNFHFISRKHAMIYIQDGHLRYMDGEFDGKHIHGSNAGSTILKWNKHSCQHEHIQGKIVTLEAGDWIAIIQNGQWGYLLVINHLV